MAESLTADQRALRSSIAAHESWANTTDPSARTEPARKAFLRRFEDQVDPDRVLPDDERIRRAESARKAHFQRLAFQSARSRAAKAAQRQNDDTAEVAS